MIDNEILQKIQVFYEMIKDNICAIVLCGSRTLDYIKNSHDIDVLLIANDKQGSHLCYESFRTNEAIKEVRDELKHTYHVSMIPGTIELFNSRLTYASYIPFVVLCGELEITLPDIRTVVNKYKQVCKTRFEQCMNDYEKDHNLSHLKSFYHIYTGMCIIEKNSYDLTKKQKTNINILHDCESEEKMIPLINQIRDWLE